MVLVAESNIFCFELKECFSDRSCFHSARFGTSYVRPQENVKLESHQDDALKGREFPKKAFGPLRDILHKKSS